MKVVIIGGVAGGATAAARLRRLDEQAEIVMLERSGYVSYANCGLPYYVGGVIDRPGGADSADARELPAKVSPWTCGCATRSTAIDPTRKTVTVRRLEDGSEYEEAYDKLLLSPGARPLRPALPGVESARVFTLRTVEDTLRLHTFIRSSAPRSAVVVGGGFIGLEMMENLTDQGIQVTVVEKQRQVMAPIDYDMACRRTRVSAGQGRCAGGWMRRWRASKRRIPPCRSRLEGGERLGTDMVVLALGVVPDTGLAKEAGLTLGATGRHRGQRPDGNLRARHIRRGRRGADHPCRDGRCRRWVPLAGPANKQGRIAADNISGRDSRFDGSQGTSILQGVRHDCGGNRTQRTGCRSRGVPVRQGSDFLPFPRDLLSRRVQVMTIKADVRNAAAGGFWERRSWASRGRTNASTCWPPPCAAGMGAAELRPSWSWPTRRRFPPRKDPVNMAGVRDWQPAETGNGAAVPLCTTCPGVPRQRRRSRCWTRARRASMPTGTHARRAVSTFRWTNCAARLAGSWIPGRPVYAHVPERPAQLYRLPDTDGARVSHATTYPAATGCMSR